MLCLVWKQGKQLVELGALNGGFAQGIIQARSATVSTVPLLFKDMSVQVMFS